MIYRYVGSVKRGAERAARAQVLSLSYECFVPLETRMDKRGKLREYAAMPRYVILSKEDSLTPHEYHSIVKDKRLIYGFIGTKDEDGLIQSTIDEHSFALLLDQCDEFGRLKKAEPIIWRPCVEEHVRIILGEGIGAIGKVLWAKKNAVRVEIAWKGRMVELNTTVERCKPIDVRENVDVQTKITKRSNGASRKLRCLRRRRVQKR